MHRWLVIAMIALLPLRGWVGEAMAGQMLAQRLAATAGQPTTAPADCHGQGALDAPVASTAPLDCGDCANCQLCPSVAMDTATPAVALLPMPHPAPSTKGTPFASAERTPGFKPPIS